MSWEQGYHYCVPLFYRVIVHATEWSSEPYRYEDSPEGPKPIAGVLCMLFIKDYCFAYEPVCV